jgi:hypothetical protein
MTPKHRWAHSLGKPPYGSPPAYHHKSGEYVITVYTHREITEDTGDADGQVIT